MPKRTADYRDGLMRRLSDPEQASYYVQAALEDSNEAFLVALRDVAEANQMAKVAKDAGVAREALYRMLSESGNPTFNKLTAVLRRLGLEIEVKPIDKKHDAAAPAPRSQEREQDAVPSPRNPYLGPIGIGVNSEHVTIGSASKHNSLMPSSGFVSNINAANNSPAFNLVANGANSCSFDWIPSINTSPIHQLSR